MTMLNLKHAAALLGGQVVQQSVLCPGPGHSRHDRSLSVIFRQGDIVVHSYAGDDWRACKDYVRDLLGLDTQKSDMVAEAVRPFQTFLNDDVERTRRALSIWAETTPVSGTPAQPYLASRGLSYTGEALRWHPSCPFGKDRIGCMVALVQNIITNVPQGIHRTALNAAGRKLSHLGSNGRMSFGPVGGGAVKLIDDADVSRVIAIGEGIETTLALRQMPDLATMPVWSVLSANGLATFPVLSGIETVWIVADNDVSGTGQKAVRASADRLTASGVETIIVSPTRVGTDLNDRVVDHGRA